MTLNKLLSALFITLLLVGCSTVEVEDDADDMADRNDQVEMMDDKDDDKDEENDEEMMDDADEDEEMDDTEEEDMPVQSSVTFVGGSSIVDHAGGFTKFSATLSGSEDPTAATLSATINIDSIFTDSDRLTDHLQKEEFFDVAAYPEATFTSSSIVKTGDDTYDVTGDLTLKGQTKTLTMRNVIITDDMIKASFDLPRKEFGIGNDSYGDKLLDVTVPVTVVVGL